jgi:SpoVK/Ycf46/Vps4 family AAA+-type ATPase
VSNKAYGSFTRYGNKYVANEDREHIKELKPGVYTPHYDSQRGVFWFQEASVLSDDILDLPSGEYDRVVSEINLFLKPETKSNFKKYGFIYKRSVLLHGLPGTGKTVIAQRLVRDVIKNNGIVLYVDNPAVLHIAYSVLKDIAPNVFKMVVFEEFDRMIPRHENDLLSILDGEVQQDNVVYVASTNFIDKVPLRLKRPGRFSSVIQVNYPTSEAREFYFKTKLNDSLLAKYLSDNTEGLSVDELKEVIQAHVILGQDLSNVVTRIKETKGDYTPTEVSTEVSRFVLFGSQEEEDSFDPDGEEDNEN